MYDVASVDSDTQITLSAPYAGTTASGAVYAIGTGFTVPDSFPEMSQGDIETATIFTRAMRKIQGKFSSILAGGANANFTTMPQVGGDPIVESGSNADGEWTRWADGTQIVRKHFGSSIGNTNTYTIQGVTFFRKEKSVTYAAAFVSNPTISPSFKQNTEDIFLSNYYALESNTTINIQFISLLSFSSYSFKSGYLTATGRWK
jgi:hypothetical protein